MESVQTNLIKCIHQPTSTTHAYKEWEPEFLSIFLTFLTRARYSIWWWNLPLRKYARRAYGSYQVHTPTSKHAACLGVVRTGVSLYYPNPPVLYASTTHTKDLQEENTSHEEWRGESEQNRLRRSEEESYCHSRKILQEFDEQRQILTQGILASVFAKGNRVCS